MSSGGNYHLPALALFLKAVSTPAGNVCMLSKHFAQIGGHFIVDASLEEEACVEASVAVFVDRKGRVCGSRKEGEGAVQLQHLGGMAQCAVAMGRGIFDVLDVAIERALATPAEGGGRAGNGEVGAAGAGFL